MLRVNRDTSYSVFNTKCKPKYIFKRFCVVLAIEWYDSVAVLCRFTKGYFQETIGKATSQSSVHSCCVKQWSRSPYLSTWQRLRVCLVTSNMKVSCVHLIAGRVEIKVHSVNKSIMSLSSNRRHWGSLTVDFKLPNMGVVKGETTSFPAFVKADNVSVRT